METRPLNQETSGSADTPESVWLHQDSTARLFVAIWIPTETAAEIATKLKAVTPKGLLPGKPLPAHKFHFTLHFLGDTTQFEYEKLLFQLGDADLGSEFSVRMGSLGAFPHPHRANVLWVGTDHGSERLESLAQLVSNGVEKAGLPKADRPFRSHLTVSRLRPHQDLTHLISQTTPLAARFKVREIQVIQTKFGPGGARYRSLASFPLTRR